MDLRLRLAKTLFCISRELRSPMLPLLNAAKRLNVVVIFTWFCLVLNCQHIVPYKPSTVFSDPIKSEGFDFISFVT